MKKYFFIANYKMNLTFFQTIEYVEKNFKEFLSLSKNTSIIICPSTESINVISKKFKDTHISIGAQNCSEKKDGPYTGETSAKSIKEAGCEYCIIGHSETRKNLFETEEIINKKVKNLIENGITPILCIGESEKDYKKKNTKEVIKKQLSGIINASGEIKAEILIAYEPLWSIGSGLTPKKDELEDLFDFMYELVSDCNFKFLYGGSVDAENISAMKKIDLIDGFLLGKASLDFQKFKKIVEL